VIFAVSVYLKSPARALNQRTATGKLWQSRIASQVLRGKF
jgi:hypothetical protein